MAGAAKKMTFQELRLLMAISLHGENIRDAMPEDDRIDFCIGVYRSYARRFRDTYFPFTADDVIRIAMNYRKRIDTRTKADVALLHGPDCFWVGRGKGDCDDVVELGHLWQKSMGGPATVENCVIECHAHNHQRSTMSVEEYIRSGSKT